ncbi:hypothetical protein HY250_00915 [Candidatus Azambacteria bacterium]|nr:hypothetical protein [Candidatus Azambacteria bacterium]MBI3684952.1 hypothetical protein [Candidatus Azambacteria bacterium]
MEIQTVMVFLAAAGLMMTTLYTLITAYIAIYAFGQFKEVRRTRQIAVFPSLRQVRSPTEAGKRAAIYNAYCENPEQFTSRAKLSRNEKLHANCKEVIYGLSEIGVLVHHRMLDSIVVTDWLQHIPAKMFVILARYVTEGEKRRGQDNYSVAFKKIAELGLEYWLESHMDSLDAQLVIYHSSNDQTKSRTFNQDQLQEMLEKIRSDLRDFGWL